MRDLLLRLWVEEHGWGRIWTGLAMAVALAGGGLVYQQVTQNNGGSATTANLWLDTNGGTCTRSSSPTTYVDAAACGSIDAARDAAQCSDTVNIVAGDYTDAQNVTSPPNSCTSSPVVFKSYVGTATFHTMNLGSPGLTIDNIVIPSTGAACSGGSCSESSNYIDFDATCDGCSLLNSEIRTFSIWGADGVLIEGNVIDAREGSGNWTDSSVEMQDSPAYDGGTNITIRNNTFRDFYTGESAPNDHGECLNIGGWTDGLLVEGNTFTSCGNSSLIFFTFFGFSSIAPNNEPAANTYPRNVCVRNNTFGDHLGAFVDVDFRSEIEAVGQATTNIRVDPDQTFSTSSPQFNVDC